MVHLCFIIEGVEYVCTYPMSLNTSSTPCTDPPPFHGQLKSELFHFSSAPVSPVDGESAAKKSEQKDHLGGEIDRMAVMHGKGGVHDPCMHSHHPI